MSGDVPGHGATDDIRGRWLNLCGHCDAGLPIGCDCRTADPRSVIGALCDALDQADGRVARLEEQIAQLHHELDLATPEDHRA